MTDNALEKLADALAAIQALAGAALKQQIEASEAKRNRQKQQAIERTRIWRAAKAAAKQAAAPIAALPRKRRRVAEPTPAVSFTVPKGRPAYGAVL